MNWIGWAFSGLWQGFLALFGMSDAQKLGRAETQAKTQGEILDEVTQAHEIEDKNAAASDAHIAGRLQRWRRD